MLKLKVIACDVLKREISYLSSLSRCYVDVTYLPQGLHEKPDTLRARLTEEIQNANEGFPYNHSGMSPSYDYILLVYGLCDNSIAGLKSGDIPLVVPRAHDCISLLLGSRKRYDELFHGHAGIYWYSRGWIECSLQPGEERYTNTYKAYLEKYGEDNAEYLMEAEQGWFTSYNRAVFIDWPCLGGADYYRSYTQKCADYLKWDYQEETGSPGLLEKMLNGVFDEDEVLVVPEHKTIVPSYTDMIIKYE
ncbi:MAG: DUF1638 domain-containing protein [Spirochaetaceae bacterium]|jgi:hypothetical protein|nr:DUF1638 domain-containing protein [Spirochaetaceae bacterium]